jgi:hypothetical protein
VKLNQIKYEIAKLKAIQTELELQAAARTRLFFKGASLFFTLQFGISYYCIYEVDWLGWDLVEPLTYTLGQGLFVTGVLYCLRNLNHENFSSLTAWTSMD